MLKRAITLSAMAVAMIGSAQAEVLYRGYFVITAVNAACAGDASKGDSFNAQFHPNGVTGNSNFSALNLIQRFNAVSHRLDGASFGPVFKTVVSTGIGWSEYTPDATSQIRFATQDPSSLAAGPASINVTGQVKNIWGNLGKEGCTATFRYVGIRDDQ